MSTVTYTVPGIHCGHCVHTIKMEIGDLKGVQTVDADLASKEVVITYSEPATPEQILALLAEINYPAQN